MKPRPGHGPARVALTAGGAALGVTVLFAPSADAATFAVTTTSDSGPGSLRQAIADANGNAGADVITFDASVTGEIALTGGPLAISDPVTVDGPGADALTVRATAGQRVFDVSGTTGATTIEGLTLTGGAGAGAAVNATSTGGAPIAVTLDDVTATGNAPTQGAVRMSGAAGDLEVRHSDLRQNAGTGGSQGGGINATNARSLTVADTTIAQNSATSKGGGVYARGLSGNVALVDSVISGNTASSGGGAFLYTITGQVAITDSVLSGNTASNRGGGAELYRITGPVTITDSTIAGNSGTIGGGLFLYKPQVVTLRGGTISGNSASSRGGGVFLYRHAQAAVIENTTIAANHAGVGGGGLLLRGPFSGSASLTLRAATIAGNDATSGIGGIRFESVPPNTQLLDTIVADNGAQDIDGSGYTVAHSLIESPGSASFTATQVLTGVDPLLGPLQDNGGPTRTMAPAAASPVVDAGSAPGVVVDQRGALRPVDQPGTANAAGGDGSDIGAVELVPSAPLLSGTTPASPAASRTVRVRGTAAAFTQTVQVFTTPDCTGTPVGTGTAAELAAEGIAVTLTSDGSTSLYARGLDAGGFPTGCSAALTYVADTVAPAVGPPSVTPGTGPAGARQVAGTAGTAAGDGAAVTIHVLDAASAEVRTVAASVGADGGYAAAIEPVLDPGDYRVTVTQADAVGNVGTSAPAAFTVTATEAAPLVVPAAPVGSIASAPASGGIRRITISANGPGTVSVVLVKHIGRKAVRVGTARAVFAAAGSQRATVTLTRTGRAMLGRHRSLKFEGRITATSPAGTTERLGAATLAGFLKR